VSVHDTPRRSAPRYFLGVDIGATKSHALIADETGKVLGVGQAGPGNHEVVGYEGLREALAEITSQALSSADLRRSDIAGAGFGVAGYDWPSERAETLAAIATLGLSCRLEAVNDTLIGLMAGASSGWGVAVIAGTSNNCWGWDPSRTRMGHVTGNGSMFAEYGGASELMWKARAAVAAEYTRRGPSTALTEAFVRLTGAKSLEDLLDGLSQGQYRISSEHAPLVFRLAEAGDSVANECIAWAGRELGSLACGVIRQVEIANLAFEVVLVGSLYNGGERLSGPMRETIHTLAPNATLVKLAARPVAGAVLLGMVQAGLDGAAVRERLMESTREHLAA
jgi:N-acetylglucosamine kinase-like BadF-type ATPase